MFSMPDHTRSLRFVGVRPTAGREGGSTTVWCMRQPATGRAAIVALIVLAIAGCGNRDEIFHGVRFSRDGTTLLAAALMPACACMTVASTRPPGGDDGVVV